MNKKVRLPTSNSHLETEEYDETELLNFKPLLLNEFNNLKFG